MILFLNFAPLNFGGGAERWMLDVSSEIGKSEDITLLDVDSSLANYYGNLVLKRNYDSRLKIPTSKKYQHHSLKFSDFIPFSGKWNHINSLINSARTIYIRYELLESLIVFYFGGSKAIKKTIAGIHSPFYYQKPLTLFDNLHNLVYSSRPSIYALSKMKKVHVLNKRDSKLFKDDFKLSNIEEIPNYIEVPKNNSNKPQKPNAKELNILFVGELSLRKGADVLIEVIKQSPKNYKFFIAGDGELKKQIQNLSKQENVQYAGYLSKSELISLYKKCDVLFMPSRAESFSLVSLEAMTYGLPVISSAETDIGLPPYVQKVNKHGAEEYLILLAQKLKEKISGDSIKNRKAVTTYALSNFSKSKIIEKYKTNLFNL